MATRQPPFAADETAADVMLREPKTLPVDATVREVRAELDNPHVQMVLLVDGASFGAAIVEIPPEADPDSPAGAFAWSDVPTISAQAPAADAFTRTTESPHRRIVVLDDDRTLLGLLCLNATRTNFCRKG
ncbi:MAG TPA: CBS domain-containing protein [Gaiellaceae bacterium]|jgi:CBS-domain-containing membrane protein|nr:CBS domain-containing protein [Gaiellaceae bacterium]